MEMLVSDCIVFQDAVMFRDVNGISSLVHISPEDVLQGQTKHLSLVKENFKAQSLKSSMDHLHREVCII